jgi:mRNA interferase MazF
MYEQKEIVLIPFPYSDLTGAKLRPALIVSNFLLNETEDRICCLITSNPTNDGIEIKKEYFEEGKLPFKSWIKPYRIFTINKNIIKKRLCRINNNLYSPILRKINDYIKS